MGNGISNNHFQEATQLECLYSFDIWGLTSSTWARRWAISSSVAPYSVLQIKGRLIRICQC